MAFHITQCPCCDSTFSISAQLLHAANGKVRCGACLSVFLAEQQLVDSEPATDGSETNDSVFVGHAPEDYFDPASFLTREALQQQPMNSRVATAESEVTGQAEAEHRSNSAPALPQSSESREPAEEFGPAEGITAEAGSKRGRERAINTSATPASQPAARPDPRRAAQTDSAKNTGEAESAGLSAEDTPVSQTRQGSIVPYASEVSEAEQA